MRDDEKTVAQMYSGRLGRRRSASFLSGFLDYYFLSLLLNNPPRPRDFLGTETRAKWLTELSAPDVFANGGWEITAVVSFDH